MASNITEFLDFLSCNYIVSYTAYNASGEPVSKKRESLTLNDMIFLTQGFLPLLKEISPAPDGPVRVSAALGLIWFAVITEEGNSPVFHILGPVTEMPLTRDLITAELNRHLEHIPANRFQTVTRSLQGIPAIPPLLSHQYALMFYYSLTGKKCAGSDIYQIDTVSVPETSCASVSESPHDNFHQALQTWHFETNLMQAVREGNLNFLLTMYDEFSQLIPLVSHHNDPVRNAKDDSILFLGLNTHAAIEGGLSPETAYQLRNRYLAMIEQSTNITGITSINIAGFEDFITRVHRHRYAKSTCSQEILHCQDYIRLHIEEELNLSRLAAHFHYTVYYFSRKFKEECGLSISDYIKRQKTEHAKHLLDTTDLPVGKISERLCFHSLNTFCTIFRKYTGMSPREYRSQKSLRE